MATSKSCHEHSDGTDGICAGAHAAPPSADLTGPISKSMRAPLPAALAPVPTDPRSNHLKTPPAKSSTGASADPCPAPMSSPSPGDCEITAAHTRDGQAAAPVLTPSLSSPARDDGHATASPGGVDGHTTTFLTPTVTIEPDVYGLHVHEVPVVHPDDPDADFPDQALTSSSVLAAIASSDDDGGGEDAMLGASTADEGLEKAGVPAAGSSSSSSSSTLSSSPIPRPVRAPPPVP